MIHLAAAALGLFLGVYGATTPMARSLFTTPHARIISGTVEHNTVSKQTVDMLLANGVTVRVSYAGAHLWDVQQAQDTVLVKEISPNEIRVNDRLFVRIDDNLNASQLTIEHL